jgi:hypothetical protein
MKLQLESWNRYLTNTPTIEGFTVEQELEFDRFLNEAYNIQNLILEDFSKIISHYSSGGILLESRECYLIEKRLNRDKQNAKILAEIKTNPKRLDEAGLLTMASIPTAIGLLSQIFGWVLKTGLTAYISQFDETDEEYIARLSSNEEIANNMADPTAAPSVASRAGRGSSPSDEKLKQAINIEKHLLYKNVTGKYIQKLGDTSNLKPEEVKDKLDKLKFDRKLALGLSKMSPFQRKVVSSLVSLSEKSTKFGQMMKDLVKKVMIKISQLFGTGLNYLCRDEKEREEKKEGMKLAFEKIALSFYCALIAAGAIYLTFAYGISPAYGASAGALAGASTLIDNAATALNITSVASGKVDIVSNIKSVLANAVDTSSKVIDTSASVAKAEKTTHFTHYVKEIWKAIKGNATTIFTELIDLISDCGKSVIKGDIFSRKADAIGKLGKAGVEATANVVDKFRNWFSKNKK